MNNTLNNEQKSGIRLLLTSKAFERLAFYLIMAILLQYLMDSLKLESVAVGYYYSAFYGIIGFTTLFSGLLGDLKDRMKIVKAGFILLPLMYLAIAFLPSISYITITALIILAIGIGLISPNIIVFLGNIYNEKGNEIVGLSGFVLFTITVNLGALIAPPLSIFLKDSFGINSIFLVAALFGLLSLFLFLKFKIQYNKINLIAEQKSNLINTKSKNLNTIILVSILAIGVLIRFALNQKGLTFTFAIMDYIENADDLNQTLNDIEKYISFIFLFLFAIFIVRLKKLNWGKIFNFIIIGLIFSIAAFVLIASFTPLSKLINEKSIFIQSYVLLIIAETLISPAILYSIYRSSPIKYKGFLQGISLFVIALSNSLLFLGALLYEKNASLCFIVFGIILLIAILLIISLKKITNNKLTDIERNKDR